MNSSVVNNVKIMYFVLFRYVHFHFYSVVRTFFSFSLLARSFINRLFIRKKWREKKSTPTQQFAIHNYKRNGFHLLMLTIHKGYFVIACNSIFAHIFGTSFHFYLVSDRFLHTFSHFHSTRIHFFIETCVEVFLNSI